MNSYMCVELVLIGTEIVHFTITNFAGQIECSISFSIC